MCVDVGAHVYVDEHIHVYVCSRVVMWLWMLMSTCTCTCMYLICVHNVRGRSAWFPPSRYSVGTYDEHTQVYTPLTAGVVGGDWDWVPKSGANETNRGRRVLWSNIGVSLGRHGGFLSFPRELGLDPAKGESAVCDTPGVGGEAPQLTTRFVPELSKLRRHTIVDRYRGRCGWSLHCALFYSIYVFYCFILFFLPLKVILFTRNK